MDLSYLRESLEQYHHESFGWALCCCNRDVGRAEEVLQTAYLKVLDGRARFDGKAAFRTWLFSVIRKTAAEARRQALFRNLRFVEYSEDTKTETNNVETYAEAAELHTLFQKALNELPARQRELIHLVFYHDLSIAEAGGILGISLGSARTHYERAKKRLRQWMEENNVARELRLAGSAD